MAAVCLSVVCVVVATRTLDRLLAFDACHFVVVMPAASPHDVQRDGAQCDLVNQATHHGLPHHSLEA